MAKITSLINNCLTIASEYPHLSGLSIEPGAEFTWDSANVKIIYDPNDPNLPVQLLHELGHAVLKHSAYKQDIVLLKLERDAWEKAQSLGKAVAIDITDEVIKNSLDTYRDWLHDRSLCPNCSATGVQISEHYECIACGQAWRPNEARSCALRRYKTKIHPV
ncbi:MAG: hypothetical protein ABI397_03665 [Candidatus Saccharimonas sp.]